MVKFSNVVSIDRGAKKSLNMKYALNSPRFEHWNERTLHMVPKYSEF